jgi:sulfatase maturation enzyme AslB (radical SAM superfamily)
MKKYYDLLDAIIDTGEAHNIKIKYQTNMSVLTYGKYNFLDYVDKFDLFEITVSLDSIGVANDYIRRRSDWEQIKSNIIKLQEYDNVQINVNGAISFLSVLRFHELIKWFNDNSNLFTQINWSNIRNPEKLRANMLPDKIKEDLIPKYEGFPDIQNLLREGNNGIHHKKAIDYFLMNDARYKGTKWEMHLFDVFPELKEYYTA